MKRSGTSIFLVAVISLLLGGIWQSSAVAAVAIESLGQIKYPRVLVTPGRLDADDVGNIYVTDTRAKAVHKIDKYGELVRSFTLPEVQGTGLAVTPDGSRIYVAGRNAVSILNGKTGEVVGHLGSGAGEFGYAGEIDLDAQGYVFVADAGKLFIRVYNAAGEFQYQFGGKGAYNGKFMNIWAMTVDPVAGEVHVADPYGYGRIQIFDLAGKLRRVLNGRYHFGPAPMVFFGGITVDDAGRRYYLDTFSRSIRVHNSSSTYIGMYNNGGYGVGQLLSPIDAIYDPSTGRLFVACDGSKIEVFGIDGAQNPEPVAKNVAPGLPVPLSPVDDSEVSAEVPELVYQNAVDEDGDELTYDVRVFLGETMTAEYLGLPEGETTSYTQIADGLTENVRHLWTVRAFDGEAASGWTEPESFYLNAVEEPPVAPALIAPLAEERLDGYGALSWGEAVDPDPFDTVSYRVEIADSADFANIVVEEATGSLSVELAALADYLELQDGSVYFWRARAVDNHGLVSEPAGFGSFLYDTTLLRVTANMPGTRVFVGGNHGFAGQYLGEAPIEIRDFQPGTWSLLAERSGFETYAGRLEIEKYENLDYYVALLPAVSSADLKARPLSICTVEDGTIVQEDALRLTGDAAPFVIDFDTDGVPDLLTGDAGGALTYYPGFVSTEGEFCFRSGAPFDLPVFSGAVPFVADWNNDGRKDLLVGAADGTVSLLLNEGSEEAPLFGAAAYLQVNGTLVDVGEDAVPVVIDLDGDGAKDLVVGSASGAVKFYANGGSDEAPELVAGGNLLTLTTPVAPFFADWDADGERELFIAASEHLYRYVRQADGTFGAVEVLAVGSDLLGKKGKSSSGAFSLGNRLRLFVYDHDGARGKDLIVGNDAGDVRFVASFGREVAPTFVTALGDKVAQIEGLAVEPEADFLAVLADVAAAIESGDLRSARRHARELVTKVPPGSVELQVAVEELASLL